jgi:hypothetical protein
MRGPRSTLSVEASIDIPAMEQSSADISFVAGELFLEEAGRAATDVFEAVRKINKISSQCRRRGMVLASAASENLVTSNRAHEIQFE